MNTALTKYRGYLVRHPAPPELAIDSRSFGYLDPAGAAYRREARTIGIIPRGENERRSPLLGWSTSEARKRRENQPEHACYGEHAL